MTIIKSIYELDERGTYSSLEVALDVELAPDTDGFLKPLLFSSRLRPGATLTVNGLKSVTQFGIKSLQNEVRNLNANIFSTSIIITH